ncbi:hypothetical protein FQR65_LT17845 [Abscondita terminalis]|nr:hypothetical protein FQR65_LT17845 [Abscondita terminalis]
MSETELRSMTRYLRIPGMKQQDGWAEWETKALISEQKFGQQVHRVEQKFALLPVQRNIRFPVQLQIESFEVKDANGNTLSASIVNNEISLYWPPYQEEPTTLTPTIVVSDRANISPASGTAISIKTDEPAQYTVKAQDGTIKTYTLKLQINQPMISARLSLSLDLVYNIGSSPTIGLSTQHILTDKALNKCLPD